MRQRRLGALALLAWIVHGQAASAPGDEVAARAHTYLQARADAGTFSGTVLLAQGSRTLFVRGYGFASEKSGRRNDVTTRFATASITKTFTAALIMKLRAEGRLALQDSICRHLAPCPAHWQSVTLHHLLTHTAGVPDYARTADFPRRMHESRSTKDLLAEFRERPLEFTPGARYSYSNSNYVLLGAALEKAGGKPYGELLRERIFSPLGMRDSGLDGGKRADLATGHKPHGVRNVEAEFVDPTWLYSAGAIYSTVGDLAKWTRALQTGELLPRADVALMWSAEHGKYGYGWQLLGPSAQTLNRRLVFHAGGTTGFATDLLFYPDDDVTVVLLANLLPVPLADISRDLSAIVFGENPAAPVVKRAVQIDASVYDEYVGVYQLAPNVTITISKDGDQLAVQATGQPRDIAIPESPTTFYSRLSPIRLSFVRDEAGRVSRLVLHELSRDISAPRKR
ncbi:MAG: serine hydrolase [Steroidobacteraceae bacterium]|nr:serine hydrolase [Steroidobacteraceae bacterium]